MDSVLQYLTLHGPFGQWNEIVFGLLYLIGSVCLGFFLIAFAWFIFRDLLLPNLAKLFLYLACLPFKLLFMAGAKMLSWERNRRLEKQAQQNLATPVAGPCSRSVEIDPAIMERWLRIEENRPSHLLN